MIGFHFSGTNTQEYGRWVIQQAHVYFLEKLPNCSPEQPYHLHSQRRCRVPPHPLQPLVLSLFFYRCQQVRSDISSFMVSICIPLMGGCVEHLFVCFFAIHTSPSARCLSFYVFPPFSNWSVRHFDIEFREFRIYFR